MNLGVNSKPQMPGQSPEVLNLTEKRIIPLYWDDHSPPHFHAKYGEYEITVAILTGVINGVFPPRALKHVIEWYELNSFTQMPFRIF